MSSEDEVRVIKAFLGAVASINGAKAVHPPLQFMMLPELDALTPDATVERLKALRRPLACVSSVVVGTIALACWPTRDLQPREALPMHVGDPADRVLAAMSNAPTPLTSIESPVVDSAGRLRTIALSKLEVAMLLSQFTLLDASMSVIEYGLGGQRLKLEFIRHSLGILGTVEIR